MQHFIITRQNMRHHVREMDLAYMHNRLDLFECFTLQSLKAQTDQNFTHIQITDSSVPDEIKKREESFGEVLYQDTTKGVNEFPYEWLGKELRKRVPEGDIVTTNLDNDDLIPVIYVEKINGALKQHQTRPILMTGSFRYFNYSLEHGLSVYYMPVYPPIFSLVENTSILKTCWRTEHSIMDTVISNRLIFTDIKYLMLAHVSNMCTVAIESIEPQSSITDLITFFESNYGVDFLRLQEFLEKQKELVDSQKEEEVRGRCWQALGVGVLTEETRSIHIETYNKRKKGRTT